MHLFGLSAIQFLMVLGASVAVVAALYRLRLRRRRVEVSFAPLWEKVVLTRPANSLFERLRQLVSFLLQVAFVTLVILAIAEPRLASDGERERSLIIVIDAGGSMQALLDPGDAKPLTRLAQAKTQALELVGELGSSDLAMIIRAGAAPDPLTPFTSDRAKLTEAIEKLRPADGPSDLAGAVRFAARLLPSPRAKIFVFTDRPRDLATAGELRSGPDAVGVLSRGFVRGSGSDEKVRWCRVGKPVDNLVITRFAARLAPESPGEYEVFYEVRNFSNAEANATLRIETDAAPPALIEETPVRLAPGGKASGIIRRLIHSDTVLRARLMVAQTRLPSGGQAFLSANVAGKNAGPAAEWTDALALDNRASAAVAAPRVLRVTLVGGEDFFLEKLLQSDPLIRWTRVASADYTDNGGRTRGSAPTVSDAADVVIFDRCTPESSAPRAIYIAPTGAASPVKASGEIRDAWIDRLADDHPVTRFVGRLSDLNIARAEVLVSEPGDVVLASSAGSPVMIARERAGRRLVAIGFSLTDSDLVLRVAFPKLFRNALNWLASDGVAQPPSAGEERTQAGAPVPHTARDESVCDLRSVPAPADVETERPRLGPAGSAGEAWPWLVAVALALTVFEWFSYHRRWTV